MYSILRRWNTQFHVKRESVRTFLQGKIQNLSLYPPGALSVTVSALDYSCSLLLAVIRTIVQWKKLSHKYKIEKEIWSIILETWCKKRIYQIIIRLHRHQWTSKPEKTLSTSCKYLFLYLKNWNFQWLVAAKECRQCKYRLLLFLNTTQWVVKPGLRYVLGSRIIIPWNMMALYMYMGLMNLKYFWNLFLTYDVSW